ncbi:MAG: HD domain-containing protein [Spirochaetaceae bacterium]|nr:HD domain-containing protein [Spirochaetaceae bacterium]
MIDVCDALERASIPCMEYGITAIDAYKGISPEKPVKFLIAEGSIVDLARQFDTLAYPGLPYADASLGSETAGSEVRFLCVDSLDQKNLGSSPYTDFRKAPHRSFYRDPQGVYPSLRSGGFMPSRSSENALFETALYASRFPGVAADTFKGLPVPKNPSALWQRDLLSIILQAPYSSQALEGLLICGFVQQQWPDLYALLSVDHAKDCHPEGGGWSHTMAALDQRKTFPLTLSLAILLHDTGKPRSTAREGHRFDRHAEIGASLAASFLRSLQFDQRMIDDVFYLIRWHMLPAALPKIPISTVSDIVLDPRFVELLELYRCDEFSTFKGPDAYYAACSAYHAYMKNVRNPYRDDKGRKIWKPLPEAPGS